MLRCKTPDLIQKELLAHLIADNLVRALMPRAAQLHHVPLGRLSFKGALDSTRHFAQVKHWRGDQPGLASDKLVFLDETSVTTTI